MRSKWWCGLAVALVVCASCGTPDTAATPQTIRETVTVTQTESAVDSGGSPNESAENGGGGPDTQLPTEVTDSGPNAAEAVAKAFAAAYSSGDTPLACKYASGKALENLTDDGLCEVMPTWREVARPENACTDSDGSLRVDYQVDHEVNRFLQFSVHVEDLGVGWFVTGLSHSSPGEYRPTCGGAQTTAYPPSIGTST